MVVGILLTFLGGGWPTVFLRGNISFRESNMFLHLDEFRGKMAVCSMYHMKCPN